MAISLDRARARLVDIMADACTVTRDADGNDTDTLDPTTLVLTPPSGPTSVYAGVCRVVPMGVGRSTGIETQLGDADVVLGTYKVLLPYNAAVVERNDVVTLTTSVDPQLVDLELRVLDVELTSMLVQRSLLCQAVL